MRALVTGSAGFVGRHIFRELRGRGYWVEGCDPGWSMETGVPYAQDAHSIFRDDTSKFDLVVHCAFHVGGRVAIDGTNTNFMKNLQLDSAMFEWAIRTQQKRVLYFSSSAAYPVSLQGKEDPFGWYSVHPAKNEYRLREEDVTLDLSNPMGSMPDSNYGWAKLTGERLAEDAKKNGLRVSVVRPFSGYGEDQSLDYPFPSIVARASQGDLSVWGPPGQTRDWIHIRDVVAGALAVVESGTPDPVNLCTGRGVEMGELAELIYNAAHRGRGSAQVVYDESKPTGVFHRVGDPTRFSQYYTPRVTIEEGIQRALLELKRK